MKKIFCTIIGTLFISMACGAFAGTGEQRIEGQKTPDTKGDQKKLIVARVNGTAITERALIDMMNYRSARLGRAAGTPQAKESLRKEALDRLIFEELAYQEAIAAGLKADPVEVDKNFQSLKVQMGGPEMLKEKFERDGGSEEQMRADIARTMVLQQAFQHQIFDKVTVSDDEIKREYEKSKGKFLLAEKVIVNDLIFFLDPDKDESVRKVEEVLKTVQENENKDLKSLVPDGTFIVKETELDKKKQPDLYEQAKKLQVGELTGVIKTNDSLQVLQLKAYSPERQFGLDDMKIYIETQIGGEKRLKRMHEWESELKKRAAIEILDTGEHKEPPVVGK